MGNAATIELKTVEEAIAAGKTQEEINAYLASKKRVQKKSNKKKKKEVGCGAV